MSEEEEEEKGLLKSWREEYKVEDVDAFLKEHGIDNQWKADCICGDGDLILRCVCPFQVVSYGDMHTLMRLFKPESLSIEIVTEGEEAPSPYMAATLCWNP